MALIPAFSCDQSDFDLLEEVVPPDGPLGADFLIINGAPGQFEINDMKPVAGPSASQLDRAISSAGLPRYRCRTTNAIKTKLPKNGNSAIFNVKGWRHKDLHLLRAKLIEEIEECAAQVIIGLGELPLLILFDEPDINAYRGSVYQIGGKIFIPTIHPSKTAMNSKPIDFWVLLLDLLKAKRLNEEGFTPYEHHLHIEPTFESAVDFLSGITSGTETAFDLETPNQSISCISFTQGSPVDAMSIPFSCADGHYFTPEEEAFLWKEIARILEDPTIAKVAQNGMFDCAVLLRYMGIRVQNFSFDTMVAQHLCWTDLPKSLGFITSIYTDHIHHKDVNHSPRTAEEFRNYWIYNARDAQRTHQCVEPLRQELSELSAESTFRFLMRLHEPLLEMQYNGLRVDKKKMLAHKAVLEEKIADAQQRLAKIAGRPLNANSPKQLQTFFYVEQGIKPYTKKGKMTTDDNAMKRLSARGVKGAAEVREIRGLRKMSGTYFVPENLDPDDKLRCEYNIAGTDTGRLSSNGTIFYNTGTNLQNQPSEFKQFVIPDKGEIFIEVDLSQAEARDVAYLSEDATMMAEFESGKDVHTLSAANIFEVRYEEVTKELRKLGKRTKHAVNYAMGPGTYALNNDVSVKVAKEQLEQTYKTYPGLKKWHRSIEAELRRGRILYNLYGRPKRFLGPFTDDTFRSAYSYKPQSSIGEALNRSILDTYDDVECDYMKLLTQVHDSCLTAVSDNIETVLLTIKLMVKHFTVTHHANGRDFVIPCDFKIGYRWGVDDGIHGVELKTYSEREVIEAYRQLQEARNPLLYRNA